MTKEFNSRLEAIKIDLTPRQLKVVEEIIALTNVSETYKQKKVATYLLTLPTETIHNIVFNLMTPEPEIPKWKTGNGRTTAPEPHIEYYNKMINKQLKD